MAVPTYPLARPPAGTDVHSLPVEKVSQAILFSHLRTAELIEPEGTLISVRLIPDLMSGGWRVRWGYGTIGSLPGSMRGIFSGIDLVHAVRSEPVAFARVCVDRERGLLDVSVELPAPELAVPRNSLPEGARLLPQGRRWPADLPAGPDRQLLGLVEGEIVTVGGEVVAALDPVLAHRLQPYLADGAPLGVRAFMVDGEAFLDVEAGDPAAVHPLPEPEPDPVPEPEFPLEGPWAVTMEAEELVDPAPAGPRTISFPVVDSDHVDR
ncbi:hypothetical protein [Corynebacterium marinum]|uniref:Uncharacterized protein n=1 Tax=Corynebacterium marinum DSM 44953 TaxID=1224162 RepID=A0A0B6TUR9_9CORY|nr:hypothetical protein [Corynebacterium marinum]AJK68476.1 hypothetical protein B840_04285 [Corynebacterium marinum DSM 44953]GGO15068.1 hypothetical protein GCM10010980_10110 [Corynebacterium marinum]